MRLHSLSLTGVGPFRGRQVIDFDAVSASGLFLIEGPTGAGKTALCAHMLGTAYDRGQQSWFVVHRRELIEQTQRGFQRHASFER